MLLVKFRLRIIEHILNQGFHFGATEVPTPFSDVGLADSNDQILIHTP